MAVSRAKRRSGRSVSGGWDGLERRSSAPTNCPVEVGSTCSTSIDRFRGGGRKGMGCRKLVVCGSDYWERDGGFWALGEGEAQGKGRTLSQLRVDGKIAAVALGDLPTD